MQANLLNAFSSIKAYGSMDIGAYSSKYLNRINNMGEALEYYVRDAMAGSLMSEDKETVYNKVYSYLGNQNNPPDIMIKGGDAFEIKKLVGSSAMIALNSSPPKERLYCTDPRITDACRECEPGWKEKELFYVVGQVGKGKIDQLLFVHGRCYAADKKVYDNMHASLKASFEDAITGKGYEKGDTVELGRVNRVDPLGITELRVRGMWQMKNPIRFFEDELKAVGKGYVGAIMLKDKYNSFASADKAAVKKISGIEIKDIEVKDPNNKARMLESVVIKMVI